MPETLSQTLQILSSHKDQLIQTWVEAQLTDPRLQAKQPNRQALTSQAQDIINGLINTTASGNIRNIESSEYKPLRDLLSEIAARQEQQGFTPFETALALTYLKDAWAEFLKTEYRDQPEVLAHELLGVSRLLDNLSLITLENIIRRRESTIVRQTKEMIEISIPVIKLWRGVVAVPIIGTLDSQRAQVVTTNLLQAIVDTESSVAILDITGVPTVDTLVAQHLIQTVAAARLMGADCIISGIRPHIAQTIVHLGITLENITTKSTLADAFTLALQRIGLTIQRVEPKPKAKE